MGEKYDSVLLRIVSNTHKMNLLVDCISKLPNNLRDDDSMRQFINYAKIGDRSLLGDTFQDLNDVQKKVISKLFKALQLSDSKESLDKAMTDIQTYIENNVSNAHIVNLEIDHEG